MNKSAKPYHVKRKLLRAALKHPICVGTFNGPGQATCVIGAYQREKGLPVGLGEPFFAAAATLGISKRDLESIMWGFDGVVDADVVDSGGETRWARVGRQLREVLI